MLWSKKKTKVATRAREMAMQVMLLYAKRENTTRVPCEPQFEEEHQRRMDETFDFEPTTDQLKVRQLVICPFALPYLLIFIPSFNEHKRDEN